MPIRINLLAEAQALEELRRRDPVKRAIWIAAAIGGIVLGWSGYLQAKAVGAKVEVSRLESQRRSRTNDYRDVIENNSKLGDATVRVGEVQELTATRLLNGPVQRAAQHPTAGEVHFSRTRS